MQSYKLWVDKINRNSEKADDEWGRYSLFLAFDNNDNLVGLLNIRYDLSDELREKYGDIGYGIRSSERRKGYATELIKYAWEICKQKDMADVILGCYENNYGSNKAILKNGETVFRRDYEVIKLNEEWSINLICNYNKIIL